MHEFIFLPSILRHDLPSNIPIRYNKTHVSSVAVVSAKTKLFPFGYGQGAETLSKAHEHREPGTWRNVARV